MSELESIINLCRMVQSGKIEPFDIDFDYVIGVIQKHYPKIKIPKDFSLDAKALKELSQVLEKQNQWIKHKSTTLYKDPFMLIQSLMALDIGVMADIFLRSWHPLVELEQVSAATLAKSMAYWDMLLPFEERWKEPEIEERETGTATREEAYLMGILPEEGFTDIVEGFWRELGDRVGPGASIDYWDWVGSETYEETAHRAYLTAFMVSYGYARVRWNSLLDEYIITHNVEPEPEPEAAKVSLPILVDYEEWKYWQNE